MKIDVVTGANGFIGFAVTKELIEKGDFVYAIVTDERGFDGLPSDRFVLIKAFFDDYPSLVDKIKSKVDVFYHFAWQGFGGRFQRLSPPDDQRRKLRSGNPIGQVSLRQEVCLSFYCECF